MVGTNVFMSDAQTHLGKLAIFRDEQRQVRVVDEDGRTVDTGFPNESKLVSCDPMPYFALALGICVTEFAQRFLMRRQFPAACSAIMAWEVDHGPRCRIDHMDIALGVTVGLSAQEKSTLLLMLEQCPLHKAIDGNIRTSMKIVVPTRRVPVSWLGNS